MVKRAEEWFERCYTRGKDREMKRRLHEDAWYDGSYGGIVIPLG